MVGSFIGTLSLVAGRLVGKSDVITMSRHNPKMIGADTCWWPRKAEFISMADPMGWFAESQNIRICTNERHSKTDSRMDPTMVKLALSLALTEFASLELWTCD
jgi:hypothetical protein